MVISNIPTHLLRKLSIVSTRGMKYQQSIMKLTNNKSNTEICVVNGNYMAIAFIPNLLNLPANQKEVFTIWGKPPTTGVSAINQAEHSCLFMNTNSKVKLSHAQINDKRTEISKDFIKRIEDFFNHWMPTATEPENKKLRHAKVNDMNFLASVFGNQKTEIYYRECEKTNITTITQRYDDGCEFELIKLEQTKCK